MPQKVLSLKFDKTVSDEIQLTTVLHKICDTNLQNWVKKDFLGKF